MRFAGAAEMLRWVAARLDRARTKRHLEDVIAGLRLVGASIRVNELGVGTMSAVRVEHAIPLAEVRICYAGVTYPVEIIETERAA